MHAGWGGLLLALALSSTPAWAATAVPVAKVIDVDVHEGTSMSVAVSPDGRTLAIDLQGSIWTVPVAGGKATRITDVFNDARQPVWSPDGKRIAFFAFRDGGYDLWSIAPDGSGQRQLTQGAYDDRDPSWSHDGQRIVFASDRNDGFGGSYNIWTLDVASGALTRVTRNAFENRLPSWSPDDTSIAYSSLRDGVSTVWAVDTRSGVERQLKAADGRIDAPSWSASGKLAYVVLTAEQSRLEVDGQVVSGTENVFPFRVSWGKNDDYFYVSDGKIRQRNARNGKLRTVAFTAALQVTQPEYVHRQRDFDSTAAKPVLGIVKPALSPDGKQIAFAALNDIYVLPIGGRPRNLTNDRYMDTDPAWSPDGSKLVYSSDKGGKLLQLWIRDLKTQTDRKLTDLSTQPLAPTWSPDGKSIAFIDVDGMWGVAGLATVDVSSGKVTRVQPTLAQPGSPTWSADGKRLALALGVPYSKSFREGTNQIFVAPAEPSAGGAVEWFAPIADLSIDSRGGGGPVWSPDGTRMAAVYEGTLRVWPVSSAGRPLGPPRSVTHNIAHAPSWAADSRTLLFQSSDKLQTVDIETGAIREVGVDLQFRPQIPTGRTVLRVGKLIDGNSERVRTDVDIVVDGNRIANVTPRASGAYGASDKVIDAPTLTAMPGLIEYHAHPQKDFGEAAHRAWLAFGVTTVRDPGNLPYHGVEDRESNEAGTRIGPRIYTTGHLMEWQRVFYKMGVAISGPAHFELELERARVLKHDLLKSYVRLPDLQQQRMVEFAHSIGIPVATHEIYPAALLGVDGTEHLGASSRRGYSPKQGPLGYAYEDVVQLFGKSHRLLTPTHFGSLAGFLQKHPQLLNDPRIDLYPEWARKASRDLTPRPNAPTANGGSSKAIRDIFNAGGRVVAGTDTPVAINLHSEIASYVDAGLTPYQALRTATVVAAESLGLPAGSIEAGKLADIVLVEGNPLEDIATTTNVRTVVANGRVYDVKQLIEGRVYDSPASLSAR